MSTEPLDVTPAWWRRPGRPTVPEYVSAVVELLGLGCPVTVASAHRIIVARPPGTHPAQIDSVLKGALKPVKGEALQIKKHPHRRQRVDVTPEWWGGDGCTSADIAAAVRRLIDSDAVEWMTITSTGINVVACCADWPSGGEKIKALAAGGDES